MISRYEVWIGQAIFGDGSSGYFYLFPYAVYIAGLHSIAFFAQSALRASNNFKLVSRAYNSVLVLTIVIACVLYLLFGGLYLLALPLVLKAVGVIMYSMVISKGFSGDKRITALPILITSVTTLIVALSVFDDFIFGLCATCSFVSISVSGVWICKGNSRKLNTSQ